MKKQLVIIISVVIVIVAGASGIYFWSMSCPAETAWSLAGGCEPDPALSENVNAAEVESGGQSGDDVKLDAIKVMLANIKSAHFVQSYEIGRDVTDGLISAPTGKVGDLVYPYDFYYKFGISSLPTDDAERDELLQGAGLGAVALLFNGMEVKRVNSKIYTKYDVDTLLETNVLDDTDDLTEEFYGWNDATYQGLNFIPAELAPFWALADIPTAINKINDGEYSFELDKEVIDNYAKQLLRLTQPQDLAILEDYGTFRNADDEINEMTVSLDGSMNIETITLTSTRISTQDKSILVFSNLNNVENIISPATNEIINDTNENINFYRWQTAEFIYYRIKELYGDSAYPKSQSVVRLDDGTDPIIMDIIEGLSGQLLDQYVYLNSSFEKDF